MNKKAKIAMTAVSVVMAGTMAFSIAGCTGRTPASTNTTIEGGSWDTAPSTSATGLVSTLNTDYKLAKRVTAMQGGWTTANSYWTYLKANATSASELANSANLSYTSGTQISIAIGHNSTTTGAFYGEITGSVSVPGGYTATTGALKPAFKAIQDRLDIKFVDSYAGDSTSNNLGNLITANKWGNGSAGTTDICTADLSKVVSVARNTANSILNLGDYLEQMPNFKAFLENNPIVYLSLLQDGMSTEDGSGKKLYVAPYFDGNDDIERYCLMRQDWVKDLLDGDLAYDGTTFSTSCATETSVVGYMGTTGQVVIETSSETGDGSTFLLKKDYDSALAAAKSESTELGAAYKAIAGAAYEGTSGNIVDIMDAALAVNAEATGKQLATLYRAYIDVAYKNASNYDEKAYETRSDLFNGYSAAWDVDDLVAMLRIVKTNAQNVGLAEGTEVTGIFPRSTDNDRTQDLIRLVAQLYGERGADSRYEFTYIDADGTLKDMRQNASFWQSLANFGTLAEEGLVAEVITENNNTLSALPTTLKGDCKTTAGTGFMIYDYSQTQTTQMFDLNSESVDSDYLFGAVSTPVSRWDDDGNGKKDTIMRFTESWRSTKTSGLCVAADVAKDTNKLNAVLTFIDFLYSNDGQILSTYGIQSTNGNTDPNGTWYGNEVTSVDITTVAERIGGQYVIKEEYESQYFCYNNKLYTGILYKGKQTPKITDDYYTSFLDSTEGSAAAVFGARGNFTNYARMIIGATLPMGVKDQSLENQLTATQAAAAATKVSVSIANGTIKHPSLIPGENSWYTQVPTGLPLSSDESDAIGGSDQGDLTGLSNSKKGSTKKFVSLYIWVIYNGFSGSYNQQGIAFNSWTAAS